MPDPTPNGTPRPHGAPAITIAAVLVVACASPALQARTLVVGAEFPTISAAIAASASGDVVEVGAGVHSTASTGERFPLELRGRRLTIRGAGVTRTTLDGNGATRLFHCVEDSSTLEGMELRDGRAAGPGGAVLVEGSNTTLRRLKFVGCSSTSGGDAVALVRAHASIEHALFEGNGGAGPTVVLEGGSSRVRWTTFHANGGAALQLQGGRPSVESCVVSRPGEAEGPVAAILLERLPPDAEPLHQIAFLECGERVRPARGIHAVENVGGFVDPARGDFRLVQRDGTPYVGDPIGAFAGENALEFPRERAGSDDGEERLGPVVPNPFSPSTSIPYTVSAQAVVDLGVFNVLGQRIRTLFAGDREPGVYRESWDGRDDLGRDMPPGVYYARVTQGRTTETRPIVLVR